MMDIRKAHERWSEDPDYMKEWETLEPEYQISRAFLQLRTRKGWSQTELAQRLDVSQSYVAKLEGGRNISLRQLWRVAHALECRVELSIQPLYESIEMDRVTSLLAFPFIMEFSLLPVTASLPPFQVKEVS